MLSVLLAALLAQDLSKTGSPQAVDLEKPQTKYWLQLPGDYTAAVVGGFPNTVAICYNGLGPFTSMNIVETIPSQTVVEVSGSTVPTLTEWGLILLALIVAGIGIVMMGSRFRPARPTT